MDFFLSLIPLIVIIVLLVLKKHMLAAGLAGGICAMIIGGMNLGQANGIVFEAIQKLFSYTAPVLYAAGAVMVSKAGSIKAMIKAAEKGLGGKVAILAGIMVLIQAFATYMAGMGAGNTMVIAPLVFAAVGCIPEVIAGMAIVTCVGFTTSPASTETILAAEAAGREVGEHAMAMMPITVLFYLAGAALAVYGVYKKGSLISSTNASDEDKNLDKLSTGALWKLAVPAIALLLFVVLGGKLNSLIGIPLFVPFANIAYVVALTVLLTPLSLSDTCDALIDGSRYILTTLFSVGIFLGFINMIAEIGTFENLASIVGYAPTFLIVPLAMIMAFLIAIPSGAFTAGVLTLILPTLSLLGMPPMAMGFVAIATGLGTQISPVQINVAALAEGFKVDIMTIIKANMKFVVGALGVLIILSFIFVR